MRASREPDDARPYGRRAFLLLLAGGLSSLAWATKANPLKIPIVIRLTGTNEEIAMKILHENGFTASSDMDEAVEKAVALAKGGQAA